jgi:hypothetical protein
MSRNIPSQYDHIQQEIYLKPSDIEIIEMVAQQRGLETNGFDTAVKLIIREWLEMQEELPCALFPVMDKHSSA